MKRILIIEDDPIVGHIYRSRLEREGFQVEIAADGQSGFYRIHDLKPDGVLLDLMLPKMNGIDILKKIRAQLQFQKLPVIVFTNAYINNMIQDSFAAGATAVYNKATLTPRQLIDSLNAVLFPAAMTLEPTKLPLMAPLTGSFAQPGDGPAMVRCPESKDPPGISPNAPVIRQPEPAVLDTYAPAKDVLQEFYEGANLLMNEVRKYLQDFIKSPEDATQTPVLEQLFRKVHSLMSSASLAGLRHVAQMASAFEALLRELHEKPKHINPSTLRTTAHAVDLLGDLLATDIPPDLAEKPPINILVVDDEVLSRRAITSALEKAFLKTVNVNDPSTALMLAEENAFDLVFLDVQMPVMDGFQVCEKLRQLETNRTTPVIFVTSMTDFKVRAQSTLSGGSDLIAKPFVFIELTVKALTLILRHRIQTWRNRTAEPLAAAG